MLQLVSEVYAVVVSAQWDVICADCSEEILPCCLALFNIAVCAALMG